MAGVRNSTLRTYILAPVGSSTDFTRQNEVLIAQATDGPVRVLVRTQGAPANIAFVAFQQGALLITQPAAPAGDFYQIPGGSSEVLVLAQGQAAWAASNIVGVIISVAVSDAFPINLTPIPR